MNTKKIITFEEKEAVLDTLYDLFEGGCPICISDIGGIEDSSYYLPNKYRDTLLNALHSHEEDVVNDTVIAVQHPDKDNTAGRHRDIVRQIDKRTHQVEGSALQSIHQKGKSKSADQTNCQRTDSIFEGG